MYYCVNTHYYPNGLNDQFYISQIPVTVTIINDTDRENYISARLWRLDNESRIDFGGVYLPGYDPNEEDPETGQPIIPLENLILNIPHGLTLDDVYLTLSNSSGITRVLFFRPLNRNHYHVKVSEILERGIRTN